MHEDTKIPLAPYILIATAIVGLANAFYLAYEHYIGGSISCALFSGCNTVANSPYSLLFGVPLAYLGLVFYGYMIGLAVLLAYDSRSHGLHFGIIAYTAVGVLASIAFESIQIFLIHAICSYCLLSAIITLALFVVAVVHVVNTKKRK